MYGCGVTAYDLSHIGHARVYVTFDVLYRYLKHLGYEVNYVRNFTDVDDKIIERAKEGGEDPISLSRRYCEEFHRDMVQLCCLPPSVEPRVSDHMPQIIDMIKQYGALRRKIGGTYKDFFKSYVEVQGEYVEEGWVDKTCKICKKDTRGQARQVDNFGRYVHVACLQSKTSSSSGPLSFFTKLFSR